MARTIEESCAAGDGVLGWHVEDLAGRSRDCTGETDRQLATMVLIERAVAALERIAAAQEGILYDVRFERARRTATSGAVPS